MSILSRKRDLVYLIFFAIHIPIVLCIDLYPLYPEYLKLQFMYNLRKFHVDTYHDQFFINPPSWFMMYTWMEAFYHLPLSIWAVDALLRNDPKLPVQLLVYAVQTAITTATCIADYLSWSGFSNAEKLELGKLYVPYLALSVFMGIDMWSRLYASLSRRQTPGQRKMQ